MQECPTGQPLTNDWLNTLKRLEHQCASLIWASSPPLCSVCKVTHLMQLVQEVVRQVKGGETNPHSNRSFHPVHA